MQRTRTIRRIVQLAFLVLVLAISIRHSLLEGSADVPSIDAICPMGGIVTLYRVIREGLYVPKTHPSSLVLGIGLVLGALIAGGAFCGWICPFGTLQDGLDWLRMKLRVRAVAIPRRIDRWMRYLRFAMLGLVLYKTISTVKLWFTGFDPYRTIFSLGWIFEFNWAEQWTSYVVTAAVLILSFIIPRFWCKYLCPLGAIQSLLGQLSILRIKRDALTCKGCAVCNAPCPVGIDVANADPRVNTNCIGCLECLDACPVSSALQVRVAPAWLDGLRSLVGRGSAQEEENR